MRNDNREKIQRLTELTLQHCLKRLQRGADGLMRYVDAIDGQEIAAHYGATHAATAFVVIGQMKGDAYIYNKGVDMLKSIVQRWDDSQRLPAFHFDFNNFALCVAYEHLAADDARLKEELKAIVLRTADSNHDTVNWLPMRWLVNYLRWQWTEEKQYQERCNRCREIIRRATNGDGSIEDRLPKGKSYNLQYNVATVGCLQFLRNHGIDYTLNDELGFLLGAVLPDGDINYQGRGTNQIFAWSMWLYLLATSGSDEALSTALQYVGERKFPECWTGIT